MRHSILVTRPAAQTIGLCQRLVAAGFAPLATPVVRIEPNPDILSQLVARVNVAQWAVFVSPSAIDLAWPLLDGHLGAHVRLATVGRASAGKLALLAGRSVCHPREDSDSTALLASACFAPQPGQKVALIKGEGGRTELIEALTVRGVAVDTLACYRRVPEDLDWELIDMALSSAVQPAIVMTSGDAADTLFALAGESRRATLQSALYAVPHPRIAERLGMLGAGTVITTSAGDDALVAALCTWFAAYDR